MHFARFNILCKTELQIVKYLFPYFLIISCLISEFISFLSLFQAIHVIADSLAVVENGILFVGD